MDIKLENVKYIYNPGAVNEKTALKGISLCIPQGQFAALVGSTGSGKSTLIQILNGLKMPASGEITYDGRSIGKDKKALRELRCRIGIVFQYPEYQLFDETVLKDAAFGPRNKGFTQEEALKAAEKALREAGLPEESFGRSPFDLSGGEKRRAAIAGVMAMEPEVLILDEPTAGLDPAGKNEILNLVKRYHESGNVTVIMVSHNMDEVAEYSDRVIVMEEGRVLMDGEPHEVFRHEEVLKQAGLSVPQVTKLCSDLGIEGPVTMDEAADVIMKFCHENNPGK
ncbi:MAG: energy-coupling factor transporter ATPase [Parasporobacterium sp.]|nr:energy-coupling factor transporter ATPase [Parasporobacterium sp.]